MEKFISQPPLMSIFLQSYKVAMHIPPFSESILYSESLFPYYLR
jgi:hypothetical protein